VWGLVEKGILKFKNILVVRKLHSKNEDNSNIKNLQTKAWSAKFLIFTIRNLQTSPKRLLF
jgi:hypothetical protein